jgi:transposase
MALFPPTKGHGRQGAFGHKGKGYTTHTMVDKRGLPLAIRITPANEAEINQVIPMLKELKPPARSVFEADKGSDSEPLRYKIGWLLKMGTLIPKRQWPGQPEPPKLLHTTRWKVEQSHAHRHLSSRRTVVCYDKTLLSFSAFVHLYYLWKLMNMLT